MGLGIEPKHLGIEACVKILLLVFGSVMFILAAVNLSSFNQKFGASFTSWTTDLAFDLKVMSSLSSESGFSPAGLQQQKLPYEMVYQPWQGIFSGVNAGCYCASGDFDTEMEPGFYEKACNSTQIRVGCRESLPIPRTQLKYWQANEILALGKIKGSSFIKLSQNMNPDGSCKAGMRKCSENHPVNKGLCVPVEWNACPITNIKTGSGDSEHKSTISLKNGMISFGTSSKVDNPWAEFTIAENEVCIQPDKVGISPGRTPYKLAVLKPWDCIPDQRFVRLDSQDEPSLFSANNIDTNRPYSYTSKESYKWFTFMKRILPWGPKCVGEVEKIIELGPRVSHANDINFILIFVTGVLSLAVFCTFQTEVNTVAAENKTEESNNFLDKAQRYRTPFSVILFCLVLWPTALMYPVVSTLSSVRECSDQETNQQMIDLHKSSRTGVFGFMCTMLFAVTVICVSDVYFLWWKLKTNFSAFESQELAPESGNNADML